MFRPFSARSLVVLVLLGSRLSSCDADEDDVSESETVEINDASVEQSNAAVEGCMHPDENTKALCCTFDIDIDDQLMKCVMLHQKKMPKEGETNPAVLVKFASCLIECIFKAKKYIGKGDSLNMNMIQADAKKKFKNDPKQQTFMIDMYQHCERHGASEWSILKKNAAAKVIFVGACKPYLLFVFICTATYKEKVKCPYFKWKGQKTSSKNTILECDELRSKCE